MLAYVDNVLSIQIDLLFIITYKIENSKLYNEKAPAKKLVPRINYISSNKNERSSSAISSVIENAC